MIDISPVSLSIEDNQDRIKKKIDSLAWDKGTRRELNEGLIEFIGNPVPRDYWKNFKSDPQKASGIIGGRGFVVRKNPETRQWEIARYLSDIQEIPVEKSPSVEEPRKEFLEGFEEIKTSSPEEESTKEFLEGFEEEVTEKPKPSNIESDSLSPPPEPVKNEVVEDINYPEDIDYPEAIWPKENISP